MRVSLGGLPLQGEHEPETRTYRCQDVTRQPASPLRQISPIQCHDLGDVRDRVFGKTRRAFRNQDIPRCIQQSQVGRQDYGNRGLDATTIERIILHNQYGAPKPRPRACGLT